MSDAKAKWIDGLLGAMTLEQKVGQMMVFGLCGPVITPDTIDLVRNHHVGGIRISQGFRIITLVNDIKPGEEPDAQTMKSMHAPAGITRDPAFAKPAPVAAASQYAEQLAALRRVSRERELGVPIHYTIDQEGSGSDDMLGGTRLFPHPMGLAASGDPTLAYRVAKSIGLQARSIGANMIHSPVLDVNTNPRNPEIGTRAYSDNAGTVAEYALQTLKGLLETGMIATGKHFPGRGESMADAHWGLPTVDLDYETLMREHIEPYKALIAAGLPAIMSAHSLYPALGETERPSSMSRKIITDFLRGELGFEGVITTDNMMMGGILKQYEMSEAIVQTLIAGNDLILCRDESPIRYKILDAVKQAIIDKRLPEAEVDRKVARILGMRWDMGLAEDDAGFDPAGADAVRNDPEVIAVANESAEKSVLLLRDNDGLLPLDRTARVLLVEQVFPTQASCNNMYSHPGLLWEEMCKLSNSVGTVEIENVPTDKDRMRLRRRLALNDFDIIVSTNYYYHKAASAISELVDECKAAGKPVAVVANTPYEFAAPSRFGTVAVCFNPGGREQMRATARLLFGELRPTAAAPVRLS